MQRDGPWCIVSQLIRVCSEKMEERERRGGTQKGVWATAGCVFLETTGSCLRTGEETRYERQEEHFHHSLWEKRGRKRERGVGHPSNSARSGQTYRVLSRYSVHRINPQCVLTNTTQLPPDHRLVCVREARSASFQTPPPSSLVPAHRHWNHSTDRLLEHVFFLSLFNFPGYTFTCNKSFKRRVEGERACKLGSDAEQRAAEAGTGEGKMVSFIYNQVISLWLMLVPRVSKKRLWQRHDTRDDIYIPGPDQKNNKTRLSNLKCSKMKGGPTLTTKSNLCEKEKNKINQVTTFNRHPISVQH